MLSRDSQFRARRGGQCGCRHGSIVESLFDARRGPMLCVVWIVLLLDAGCLPLPAAGQASQPAFACAKPVAVCEITDGRLDEASGLAASRRYPDLYYTHNDSGGKPYVYVLDRNGRIVAEIRLKKAANLDWEDIALAPGAESGVFEVCAADIGDNLARRAGVEIYRFAEPEIKFKANETVVVKITPRIYRAEYADGPRNAEGFAVDPRTGDGYVFSKREDGRCDVYCMPAPWDEKNVVVMKKIGELRFPPAPALATMVTGADLAPDGRALITRSYVCGWEWRAPTDAKAPEFLRLIEQTPTRVELAPERQGEGIGYAADGNSVLTISEGSPTTLNEVRFK